MEREHPVAVVTGAARGIGRQVALILAERGYAVAANDLAPPEGTVAKLRESGALSFSLPGDVSDETSACGMVGAVIGEFGRVDVLVNNAGVSAIVPAEETTLEDIGTTPSP